jgi:hypothetical protein
MRPATVEVATPIKSAPLTPRTASAPATKMPSSAISAGPVVRSPSPIPVAGLFTTMPPSRRPTRVMKRPMPTPIDSFSDVGIARMTASRAPAATSTTATSPSTTTTAMPVCHGKWRPRITSKATTAFRPRPDASANG